MQNRCIFYRGCSKSRLSNTGSYPRSRSFSSMLIASFVFLWFLQPDHPDEWNGHISKLCNHKLLYIIYCCLYIGNFVDLSHTHEHRHFDQNVSYTFDLYLHCTWAYQYIICIHTPQICHFYRNYVFCGEFWSCSGLPFLFFSGRMCTGGCNCLRCLTNYWEKIGQLDGKWTNHSRLF